MTALKIMSEIGKYLTSHFYATYVECISTILKRKWYNHNETSFYRKIINQMYAKLNMFSVLRAFEIVTLSIVHCS
jgi:hypothetical protein